MDVKWRNDNDFALNGTVTWQAARLRVPGPNNNPAEQYLTLNVSGSVAISLPANGESAPIPLTITGVPNYVAVGQLEIKYDMPLTKAPGQTGNNGTQGNFHGWERIPLIDAAPVGLQETPWADLCEYSCRWAFGYSGATNVRRELTRGLHYSNRAPWNQTRYDPNVPRFFMSNDGFYTLNLTLFLNFMGDPWQYQWWEVRWTTMYCADYAAVLQQSMETQGIAGSCDFLEWIGGPHSFPGGTFYTWPMCPAGTDASQQGNYRSYGFGWHLVNRSDGLRFDSVASYYYLCDPQGSLWKDPAWEWPLDDHWQSDPGLFGLAFGPITCTPHFPLGPPYFSWNLLPKEELSLTMFAGFEPVELE